MSTAIIHKCLSLYSKNNMKWTWGKNPVATLKVSLKKLELSTFWYFQKREILYNINVFATLNSAKLQNIARSVSEVDSHFFKWKSMSFSNIFLNPTAYTKTTEHLMVFIVLSLHPSVKTSNVTMERTNTNLTADVVQNIALKLLFNKLIFNPFSFT